MPTDITLSPTKDLSAMLMLNIQGMVRKSSWKIQHLEELVRDSREFIPFISITESWTKKYMSDRQIAIKNYNVFRAERSLRIKGGAVLYIHNSISVDNFWCFDNKVCEVGVALMKDAKTLIVSLYLI